MNKPNISKFVKSVQTTVTKHSPEILTGIGIVGMISSTVMAVKATPKALQLIEEEKERQNIDICCEAVRNNEEPVIIDKLKPVEVVKTTWKCYIPATVTGCVSIACLIGASSVNAKRNAALATAYTLTETAFKEYKEKVVETIGEKKEQVVKDKVAKEHIEKNPIKGNEVIITGKGNVLCCDSISKRYFRSDIEKIRKAVNDLNYRLNTEMYISLNDFYYELGLSQTRIGDDLGWNINNGLIEVDFSSQITEDGEPCLVIDYHIEPRYDYSKLY